MSLNSNVIYLAPPQFSGGLKSLMTRYMRRGGLPLMTIRMAELTKGCLIKKGKKTWVADPEKKQAFDAAIAKLNPSFIIINDKASLEYITDFRYKSINAMRGSLLYWKGKVPCIVLDKVHNTRFVKHAGWALLNDCRKIQRFLSGQQRNEPAFNLTVCRTIEHVHELHTFISESFFVGMDVETSGQGRSSIITSSSYTAWRKDGVVKTFVVPFVAPYKDGGCFWETEEAEVQVHLLLRKIHASDAVKVMQNGAYDSHYYIAQRFPVRNYLLDTAHVFHAMWPEAPKRIDFIAAFACDYYAYWKDEGKEEEKDDNEGKLKMPQTEKGCERYWRYNGLDTHYTSVAGRFMLAMLLSPGHEWGVKNYVEEFRAQMGPALRMSVTGVHVNTEVQWQQHQSNMFKADEALATLRFMVDDNEFNPKSPQQYASLVYDVLRANEIKGKGRTVNESIMKLVQTQSPLLFRVIQQVWDSKKPANLVSKYGVGNLKLMNGRWMYTMNAAGTETWRYASKQSYYWVGTQIQNVPYPARTMVEADEGYFLFDADYGQSDAYFTAFESGDPDYIRTMLDDRDTHCVHASQFFQRDYNELLEGYLQDAEWVTESTTGIRQITKRIVYGANYLMAAFTLFITMGKKSVVAAAQQLGYDDAHTWNQSQLIHFCQRMLDFYFNKMYPTLQPWLQEEIQRAVRNGNKAVCAFGKTRTFFGNLETDSGAQRELAAFFGQGGTAGNINKAIDRIYYGSSFYGEGGMLLFQVHDSIVGQIPRSRLDLLNTIVDCMDNTCNVKGREFHVPVDVKVGVGWGKRMMNYKPGVTQHQIEEKDRQWHIKFQQNTIGNVV